MGRISWVVFLGFAVILALFVVVSCNKKAAKIVRTQEIGNSSSAVISTRSTSEVNNPSSWAGVIQEQDGETFFNANWPAFWGPPPQGMPD